MSGVGSIGSKNDSGAFCIPFHVLIVFRNRFL